jgi:hypothetical protein
MTDAEKIAKFEEIQQYLWDHARHGNGFISTMVATIIRTLRIPSPEGDDPESA